MSDSGSISNIQAQWRQFIKPVSGQRYRHCKCGLYEIIAAGFMEAFPEPCVVYRSLTEDMVWVRTAKDFFESVEYQGTSQPRFTSVEQ